VEGNKLLHSLPETGSDDPMAWSPDGKRLAYRFESRNLRVWDAESDKVLFTCRGAEGEVTGAAFSADGKTLISCDTDKSVRFWDADTGRRRGGVVPLKDHQWLAVGPEGHYRGSPHVEDQFVYVLEKDDGKVAELTSAEFAREYGRKNDPDKVQLLAGQAPKK
jgi:WD40 repeat protein